MKVTKKSIVSEIKKIHGVDVILHKDDGFYYWCGKPAAFLNETNTFLRKLDGVTLERWVNDFNSKVEDYLKWSDYNSIKEAVEKTNWEL